MDTATTHAASQRAIPADTLAHRLMLARAHAGHLSIREAADRCGIGRGAWTNWEKGARPVDLLSEIERISEGLGVDRDWLLFGGQLSAEVKRRRDRHGRRTPAGRINERSARDPSRPAAGRPPGRPDTTRSAPPDRSAAIKTTPTRTARTRPHWTDGGATT